MIVVYHEHILNNMRIGNTATGSIAKYVLIHIKEYTIKQICYLPICSHALEDDGVMANWVRYYVCCIFSYA